MRNWQRRSWVLGLLLALAFVPAPALAQDPPNPPGKLNLDPPPPAPPGSADDNGFISGLMQVANWPEDAWDLLTQTQPTPHPGQFGQPGAFNPNGQAAPFLFHYSALWFPTVGVNNQNTNLGYVSQDIGIMVPLFKDDTDMLGLTTNVRSLQFHTLAVLPENGPPVPQDLWDIRFGLNFKHTFDNGWSTGGEVTVGSASDKPFHSIDEMTASVLAFLRIPVGEHNAWLFSVMYSPTGELAFPIPGVAFYWQPSDNFNATIGIPFKVWWRPIDDLTFEASYMPLTNLRARVSYHVYGGISVYAGYENTNEAYFLADRTDVNDRFFIYDQRLTTGAKLEFGKHVSVDLSGGYSFDRHIFEGRSLNDDSDRLDIANTPYLSLMFQVRY
jgi:hypothetical protein